MECMYGRESEGRLDKYTCVCTSGVTKVIYSVFCISMKKVQTILDASKRIIFFLCVKVSYLSILQLKENSYIPCQILLQHKFV